MPWLFLILFPWTVPALAEGSAALQLDDTRRAVANSTLAKPARIAASTTGTRRALVLFARFKGEDCRLHGLPIFSTGTSPEFFPLLDDTMSFGKSQVRGGCSQGV